METETLVETLESAGLSPYEAAAYVALLDIGTRAATELAEASDVESAADETEQQWEQPPLESTKASIAKRFRTVSVGGRAASVS